eukprot:jgi/Chlat1/2994/Chrsp2S08918
MLLRRAAWWSLVATTTPTAQAASAASRGAKTLGRKHAGDNSNSRRRCSTSAAPACSAAASPAVGSATTVADPIAGSSSASKTRRLYSVLRASTAGLAGGAVVGAGLAAAAWPGSDTAVARWMTKALEARTAAATLSRCLLAVLWTPNDHPDDENYHWWAVNVAATLADLAANDRRRFAVAATARGQAIDWLLDAVSSSQSQAVRAEAARALSYMLDDAKLSSTVLARSEAVPRLLSALKQETSSVTPLPVALTFITGTPSSAHRLPSKCTASDVKAVVEVLKQDAGAVGRDARQMAAWALAAWAEGSRINRRTIKDDAQDLSNALVHSTTNGERTVRWHAARAMAALAQDDKAETPFSFNGWVDPLISMATAASAALDMRSVRAALDALTACIRADAAARAMLCSDRRLAQLLQLANSSEDLSVQQAIACAVAALAADEDGLQAIYREPWVPVLLQWACKEGHAEQTRNSATSVLARIANIPGIAGNAVVHAWLAQLLLALATPDSSVPAKNRTLEAQGQAQASVAAAQLAAVAAALAADAVRGDTNNGEFAPTSSEPSPDLGLERKKDGWFRSLRSTTRVDPANTAKVAANALKAMAALVASSDSKQQRIIQLGGVYLLRRLLLSDDINLVGFRSEPKDKVRRQAARVLAMVAAQPGARAAICNDVVLCDWLEACADGRQQASNEDRKFRSSARRVLWNVATGQRDSRVVYRDGIHLLDPQSPHHYVLRRDNHGSTIVMYRRAGEEPDIDLVFVHGLLGGAFKTWRIRDDCKGGGMDTCWPADWMAKDLPSVRFLSLKHSTSLSEWTGAALPLEQIGRHLLEVLVAAGVGDRPVLFVTHSMGGLVAKQILKLALADPQYKQLADNLKGMVFYTCPHFGSRLAHVPWGMAYVLRPAPSVNELRRNNPVHDDLNKILRTRHSSGKINILSFAEGKTTKLLETYGGVAVWAEIVPLESAYPGFGEFIVLPDADHVNACKPCTREDVTYAKVLELVKQQLQQVAPVPDVEKQSKVAQASGENEARISPVDADHVDVQQADSNATSTA